MDAPILRLNLILLSLLVSTGATFQTPNFTVTAPTAEIAEQVGKAAETYRRDLAVFWLERPLPNWSRPCVLRVRPGSMGAGGETKFQFAGGEVLNWNMYVQGSMERILDSVLPHEVNHTIFACHFRRPLPRWADEGAATLFEHRSEQLKQLSLLNQVIKGGREFISLRNLLTMKEYPRGYRPMLILYSEGYALADFLVQQGGRKKYLKFLADGERIGWTQAIKANYHHEGVDSLQKNWQSWVIAGMPKLNTPTGELLASRTNSRSDEWRPAILDEYPSASTIRSQSPDSRTDGDAALILSSRPDQPHDSARPGRNPERARAGQAASGERTLAGQVGPSTVFVGMPVSRRPRTATASDTGPSPAEFRSASFEAPRPRPAKPVPGKAASVPPPNKTTRFSDSRSDRFQGLHQASGPKPAGLERTRLSQHFGSSGSHLQRKHLPQERDVATGSTPQWAGFPGQKELF